MSKYIYDEHMNTIGYENDYGDKFIYTKQLNKSLGANNNQNAEPDNTPSVGGYTSPRLTNLYMIITFLATAGMLAIVDAIFWIFFNPVLAIIVTVLSVCGIIWFLISVIGGI